MRTGQRVAVSLLVSVLLFAAFAVVAFAGLFDFVESRFYQPMVVRGIEGRLEKVAQAQERYSEILFRRFESFAREPSVRTLADLSPDDAAVQERERRRVALVLATRALKGIRVIDPSGVNILYSSFVSDILAEKDGRTTYRKYSELTSLSGRGEIAFPLIRASEADSLAGSTIGRIFRDGSGGRLVFSLPFRDGADKAAGTIAFYLDPADLNRFLYEERLIDVTGFGELLADDDGFGGYVFSLPNAGRDSLEKAVLDGWRTASSDGVTSRALVPELPPEMDGEGSERPHLVMFSVRNRRSGFSSWVYDAAALEFPGGARVLILVLVFVTLFLLVFLVASLRRDDMAVIRERIRRFQIAFVLEAVDSETLPPDLASQKERMNEDIRRSLGRRGRRHAEDVDALLERSWESIFSALGVRGRPAVDSEELRRVLTEVLGSGVAVRAIPAEPFSAPPPVPPAYDNPPAPASESAEPEEGVEKSAPAEEIEEAESAEEIEEAESAEEIEEAESAEEIEEAESAEEIEEAESAEEIEEAESAEEIEEVESAEEIEEVESAEEIEEAESAEEIEEVESAEEIEEAESAEEIEEVESAEEIEEAESAEEIEEAESAEEIEEAESAEEIEEAESAEEIEEVESAEEIEEAESAEEIEEVESAEEIEEAESAEEIEEVESAEEIEEAESAEEIEEAEPAEEIEEVESAEEIEEAESAEEIESVEAAKPAEDVEETALAEETDESEIVEESAEGTAPAEESEIVEESAEGTAPTEESEIVEEAAEEIEEAESAEEIESVEAAKPAEDVEETALAEETDESEIVEESVEEAAPADEAVGDAASADGIESTEEAEESESAGNAAEDVDGGEYVAIPRPARPASSEVAAAEGRWLSAEDFPDDEGGEPLSLGVGDEETAALADSPSDDEQALDGSFSEELQFGSPEPADENPEDDGISDSFSASSPDFAFLDAGDPDGIDTNALLDFAAVEAEPLDGQFLFVPLGQGGVSEVESAD